MMLLVLALMVNLVAALPSMLLWLFHPLDPNPTNLVAGDLARMVANDQGNINWVQGF